MYSYKRSTKKKVYHDLSSHSEEDDAETSALIDQLSERLTVTKVFMQESTFNRAAALTKAIDTLTPEALLLVSDVWGY